ncbi:hypothetical protein GCM10007881_20080 [Mesorhizobium huakuii]|nr:hypothetical protein GCM10007881_20080 [Mesorhizobium huakuii]
MAVPSHYDRAAVADLNARGDKLLGRIYEIWLLGVFVNALGLRPSNISADGVSFNLSHPEIITGLIYIGCLLMYAKLFTIVAYLGVQYHISSYSLMRRIMYISMGRRKTFRVDKSRIKAIKLLTKFQLIAVALLFFIVLVFPALHIFLVGFADVVAALALIFPGP